MDFHWGQPWGRVGVVFTVNKREAPKRDRQKLDQLSSCKDMDQTVRGIIRCPWNDEQKTMNSKEIAKDPVIHNNSHDYKLSEFHKLHIRIAPPSCSPRMDGKEIQRSSLSNPTELGTATVVGVLAPSGQK